MKFLIKNLLCVLTLAMLFTTTSCNKDELYNITTIDSTLINNNIGGSLASIAFVSDYYNSGIPAFSGSDVIYTYSGTSVGGNQVVENIFTSSSSGLPIMKFRLNPSDVKTDSIQWSIIRREAELSTSTKIVEGDETFAGKFNVTRSTAYPAELKITVTQDNNNFFQTQNYLYALVANYKNKQIVSDLGLYQASTNGQTKQLDNVFLGFLIDGKVVPCDELDLQLIEKPTFLPIPTPYGEYENEVFSFEELGISESDYIVDVDCNNKPELPGGIEATEKLDDNSELIGWDIAPSGDFADLDFDDFNSDLTFDCDLYNDDKSILVESSNPSVYTKMDDMIVKTTITTDINDEPIYPNTISTLKGYDLTKFTNRYYGYSKNSFEDDYTKVKYFIDDKEVTQNELYIDKYSTEAEELAYNIILRDQLATSDHTLRIEISSDLNNSMPKFIHIADITVADIPAIDYPEVEKSALNTYGAIVNNQFEMTAALSDLFSLTTDNTKPTNGFTYSLRFTKEQSGKFKTNDGLYNTLTGDFAELKAVLNSTRVGLPSDLVGDISKVEIILETKYQGILLNQVISTVGFKNPFYFDIKPAYVIKPEVGSQCDIKEDLVVTMEADDNTSTVVYEDGKAVETKFGLIVHEFINSNLIDEVEMSQNGVVEVLKSVYGKQNVGSMTITFRAGGQDFAVVKTMKPEISVKEQ